MQKIIIVDHERCTGCRLCEMVCSVTKEGMSDPSRARIHVNKSEMEGRYLPILCQHCEDPLCATVCPVNAIQKGDTLGRVTVEHEKCVGCQACVSTCTLGSLRFDDECGRVLRCDLCGGDPACIKFCSTRAIQYVDSHAVMEGKKNYMARGLKIPLKGRI